MRQTHISYHIKFWIEGNDVKIVTVKKRFSELSELHRLLVDRKKIDVARAPAFPDKNNLHQNWYIYPPAAQKNSNERIRYVDLIQNE